MKSFGNRENRNIEKTIITIYVLEENKYEAPVADPRNFVESEGLLEHPSFIVTAVQ